MGLDINCADRTGITPLMEAASEGNLVTSKYSIKYTNSCIFNKT